MFITHEQLFDKAGVPPNGPYDQDDLVKLADYLAALHNSSVMELVNGAQDLGDSVLRERMKVAEKRLGIAVEIIKTLKEALAEIFKDPEKLESEIPLILSILDKYAIDVDLPGDSPPENTEPPKVNKPRWSPDMN